MTGRELHKTIIGELKITAEKIIVIARAQVIERSEDLLSEYGVFKPGSGINVLVYDDKDDCPCTDCQEKRVKAAAARFFKDKALNRLL
jgi:hypothetical protein